MARPKISCHSHRAAILASLRKSLPLSNFACYPPSSWSRAQTGPGNCRFPQILCRSLLLLLPECSCGLPASHDSPVPVESHSTELLPLFDQPPPQSDDVMSPHIQTIWKSRLSSLFFLLLSTLCSMVSLDPTLGVFSVRVRTGLGHVYPSRWCGREDSISYSQRLRVSGEWFVYLLSTEK